MTVAKEEPDRLELIKMVMAEREGLANAGKELLDLMKKHNAGRVLVELPNTEAGRTARLEIEKKILDLSKHLGNIAGFCDSNGRRAIYVLTTGVLDVSMISSDWYFELRTLLPSIVGINVDYTKKPPFKLIGIDVKALGSQIKAFAQR
jgi:hypothetical protein